MTTVLDLNPTTHDLTKFVRSTLHGQNINEDRLFRFVFPVPLVEDRSNSHLIKRLVATHIVLYIHIELTCHNILQDKSISRKQ